jgi:phosphoglycolate phosphatase
MPALPRAVVFDLDGTLVETLPDIADALNRALAERGIPHLPHEETRLMIGAGARVLVERALEARDLGGDTGLVDDCYARFLHHYEAVPAAKSEPFPGVCNALDALAAAGCGLGVCTNKPHGLTLTILEALGLAGYFGEAVLGGDALPVHKPDGEHLLAVLDRLGAAPHEAVMVGDSATDVAAARNAGVRVVVVPFGYTGTPAGALGADGVVESFDALESALRGL